MNKDKVFKQYTEEMRKRWKKGTKKYGNLMSKCDKDRAIREIREELIDVSNHAFLLYLRQLEMFERRELK